MIIWGSGGDIIHFGPVKTTQCGHCNTERPFNLMLQYRYGHLYYVFGFVTKKEYVLACDTCSRGIVLDSKETESRLGKSPIPFMRRFGMVILIALIVGLVMFAAATDPGRR